MLQAFFQTLFSLRVSSLNLAFNVSLLSIQMVLIFQSSKTEKIRENTVFNTNKSTHSSLKNEGWGCR